MIFKKSYQEFAGPACPIAFHISFPTKVSKGLRHTCFFTQRFDQKTANWQKLLWEFQ